MTNQVFVNQAIEFNYNDGGREAAGFGSKAGDCVCRAIAIATGKPYENIYKVLAYKNSIQRQGKYEKLKKNTTKGKKKIGKETADHGIHTNRKWFKDYMIELGFEWVPTMFVGQGCKVHLRYSELPEGRLVVNVSKHMTAVIDRVLNDTYDCSRQGDRCVYGYYKLKTLSNEI